MATSKLVVVEFKDGFAVIDPAGKNKVASLGGEVITRVQSKEQADEFVRLQKGA